MLVPLLRKPDFQRETNHWTSVQVVSFLESFLDNELIPSIILWQSESYVFVIDGGQPSKKSQSDCTSCSSRPRSINPLKRSTYHLAEQNLRYLHSTY